MFLLLQGGRDMLKDVWENVDMMDPENFDPKLFFKLHGNTPIFKLSIQLIWYGPNGVMDPEIGCAKNISFCIFIISFI